MKNTQKKVKKNLREMYKKKEIKTREKNEKK